MFEKCPPPALTASGSSRPHRVRCEHSRPYSCTVAASELVREPLASHGAVRATPKLKPSPRTPPPYMHSPT